MGSHYFLDHLLKTISELPKTPVFFFVTAQEHSGNPKQPDKPLIRLRIDYSEGFEPFSTYR